LGISEDFTDWFKSQTGKCILIEGQDYTEFTLKCGEKSGIKRKRGRPAIREQPEQL
jgi:hypothetical protein